MDNLEPDQVLPNAMVKCYLKSTQSNVSHVDHAPTNIRLTFFVKVLSVECIETLNIIMCQGIHKIMNNDDYVEVYLCRRQYT